MEFEHAAHKAAYERCLGIAREAFGESLTVMDDQPGFGMRVGSTLVLAFVNPWSDDDATLRSMALVVRNAEVDAELTKYLLRENNKMRFGAFNLNDDDAIFFNYTVVASTIDKEEFKACILAVAHTADSYDDKIMQRWGGQRVADN